ncbi:uncharacterized protein K02A2.6-like [Armigeres subalbatus]|uniref:uncharacterized protein K02A2.6-like n=1 Tax=Armigeres subalbatus TaxID=124917 RepID=UPI002ED1E23D
MSGAGKYVRAPHRTSLSENGDSSDDEVQTGQFVRAPLVHSPMADQSYTDDEYAHYSYAPDYKEKLEARVLELENVINELKAKQRTSREEPTAGEKSSPTIPYIAPLIEPTPSVSSTSGGTVRWDNIKPFPKNVPATKMWEAWIRFLEDFEIAVSLSNLKNPKRRVELLLLSMGDELKSIVRAAKLRPASDDDDCYNQLVKNIDQYLKALTDPAAEHEDFSKMCQEEGESAVKFHARLTEKVLLCDYSPMDQERFVRTQLLRGLRNQEVKKTARTYGHDSNTIVQAATRAEAFQSEVSISGCEPNVLAVSSKRFWNMQGQRKRQSAIHQASGSSTKNFKYERSSANQENVSRRYRCPRCYRLSHRGGVCPALSKTCNSCGQRGHFAVACRVDRVNTLKDKSPEIPVEEDQKEQFVNALSLQDVLVDCRVGSSTPIKFLIDSGADVNVIGGTDWHKLEMQVGLGTASVLRIPVSKYTDIRAYASDKPMQVKCCFRAKIEAIGLTKPVVMADFLVVADGRRSLLGRATASDMELLKVGGMVNTCEQLSVFPKVPGVKVRFSIDHTIPPVRNAYYNIPAAYREEARRRLKQMETRGIIERVNTAPLWISGMSAVPKGKTDFRLVVNMRAPNKAIKREYFRLPLIDEMKVKLHGARFFSKLDLSDAFYHLELSEESRELTTFLSENGMYRFTRLMFGVNCAPEVFQREMTRILKDVENKIIYIDDILLFADTLEHLRTTVAHVLKTLRSNNLTLNTSKCEFDCSRLSFLGHEVSEEGFNIEASKVKDIRSFRHPTTSSELRSFLGLASFVSPYIKNFAEITAPLWSVSTALKWSWGDEQKNAFELVKQRIIDSTTSLGFFSESEKTILYTDASPNALGAVLVQEDDEGKSRIISFASKSLTATEKKYAQNQREALSAVWAVEHFSYFLLGRYFILRTDAQGMTFILSRTREESKRALTRADGWALRLSPYNYDVEYIKGNNNIADPSSRLYCGKDDAFNEELSPWEVCHLGPRSIEFLTESEIREYMVKDDNLIQVVRAMETQTWPKKLMRFKSIANDLVFVDGILVKNGCIVIPQGLRQKTLEIAHAGHPLEAKLKSILRRRVWWPGMAADAENWVKTCAICAVNGRPERPPPMQRAFAPKSVWETIAIDFNGPYQKLGGISILVIIDLRSRYAIARPVKSTKFEYTRAVLDSVFEREGFPRAIKSDNGPPFNGEDYAKYCSERGIQTVFSTPFYPQQNGLVEGFMKNINKAMSAALSTEANFQKELQAAVQAYNAADHSITKMPPEEVLVGRKIKRGLPLLNYGRTAHDEQLLDDRDREAKLHSKRREDARRGAKESKVKPGDTVIVERQTRAKGESRFSSKRYTVMEERNGHLVLCDEDGQQLKRHVSQTKRVRDWRRTDSSETPRQDSESIRPAGEDHRERPQREKRLPSYLSEYALMVEQTK